MDDARDRPLGRGPLSDDTPPREDDDELDDDNDGEPDNVLDIALMLAASGLDVFPCSANKRPAIPEDKGGRGCLDATTDPDQVRALFGRAPNARLVGVACGPASGVDILDIDPRHGGDIWEREHVDQLPETLIHSTPGGGRHYVFRHHPGVRNRQGVPAVGVDVRGEGGYAIWPASTGYEVIHDVEPAEWPPWLLDQIIRTNPPPRPFIPTDPTEISDARLSGLLRSLLARLSNAPEGQKHSTLLAIARTIGGYAHLLDQSDDQLDVLMLGALPSTVRDWKNAGNTARDGLAYGRAAPLELENRPRPGRSTAPDWNALAFGETTPGTASSGGEGQLDAPPPAPASTPVPITNGELFGGGGGAAGGGAADDGAGSGGGDVGGKPPGSEDPNAELRLLIEDQRKRSGDKVLDGINAVVDEFNARYLVVNEHGKAIIYQPRHDPILNRRLFDRLSFEDLVKLYANRFVLVGYDQHDKPAHKTAAKLWIGHPRRRQFIGGITFDPANRNIGFDVLNLWDDFAVEPKPGGSWAKLQRHTSTIICGSDPFLYEYLLDWMADVVQHPAKQGEVAIAIRGIEGCGKGILARALRYLLGQHGLAVSHARHVTGNFNAHLRDCVFLFLDEDPLTRDKRFEGVLRALITEPYLMIEGKYQNAVQAPNFLHVMVASNEDWVVPVSLRSRRWVVLDARPDKANDHPYFAAIQAELENGGGYEAMLHDLLRRDLSRRNLRAIPITAALQEQRQRSIDTTTRWWLTCLHRGYVFESKLGLEKHWQEWHEFLPTEVLFASYIAYCGQQHERNPLNRELFGKWLRTNRAAVKEERRHKQAVGEHMIPDGFGRVAELIIQERAYGYVLGGLTDARERFSDRTGLPINWEPATEDDPPDPGEGEQGDEA
jgi:hypothetical protein